MIASINTPEPTVTLHNGEKMMVDLKSFSPEGTKVTFNPKLKWSASLGNDKNPPEIIMGKFKGVDAILDFLHECGHLHDATSTRRATDASIYYDKNFYDNDPSDRSPERIKALSERWTAVVQSERNAWAYALRNTRKLEQQFGINIIEKMGGVNDVVKYINSYLNNCEQATIGTELEHLGFEIYSLRHAKKIMEEIAA